MSTLNFLFLGFLFLLVASLVYLALNQWTSDDFEKRRLGLVQPSRPAEHAWLKRMQSKMMALLLRMSPWAGTAAPEDVLQPSALQMRLLNAGIRSGLAVPVFLGLKTFLTFFLPACFVMLTWLLQLSWSELMFWTGVMAAAALGYYTPNAVLHQLVKKQQKILFHAVPDALDLMRLCVQAGLGLDAAIERVGREMRLSYPQLSDEFALTGLELRAGSSRAEALRHLSQRMGLPDIEGLVAMLIQADRFGTSIAESLEVHSDALRTKRRLIAEEAAAKLPIKLLIPLIFCVFPALMTVLLGPVVISITQHLFPLVNG
ncbi:type II secretion system F family protein [uncultured Limnohabitans sp.]|jgi:tight adherence protein C|uniref:type II secretion system F family protein n=1 Tax=uncultured Limnohabitans sp. TaxID=768543 RepID=UPI002607B8A0|nr:type II secretion system F family protein [uncultured Limnohabitans sp.]